MLKKLFLCFIFISNITASDFPRYDTSVSQIGCARLALGVTLFSVPGLIVGGALGGTVFVESQNVMASIMQGAVIGFAVNNFLTIPALCCICLIRSCQENVHLSGCCRQNC